MLKNNTINLKVVQKVAKRLGELNKEVVFVGGAVVSLYATDKGAEEARPTKDIDISVQVSTYSEMNDLRETLANKGIFPAINESVMYRYKYEDILIDFIPFDSTPLGPTNSWLKPGFDHLINYELEDTIVRILTVPYYLATKWEAYENRGSDPRWSHDLEDIIYVIDNNLTVVEEILKANSTVRTYLIKALKSLSKNPNLNEIIECHINPFTAKERSLIILEKVNKIIQN